MSQPPPSTPRVSLRARVQLNVAIRSGERSWKGVIHDISSTGARIEQSDFDPEPGHRLLLHAFLEDREARLWISAEVVRSTVAGGFAVRFLKMDSATRQLLRRLEGFRATPVAETASPARPLKEIAVRFQAQTSQGVASVVGITLDGLFLACSAPPRRGEEVRLTIEGPTGRKFSLQGIACWKRVLPGTDKSGFSVKLDKTTDEYLGFYTQFLAG